jgi:hypothetical protein
MANEYGLRVQCPSACGRYHHYASKEIMEKPKPATKL